MHVLTPYIDTYWVLGGGVTVDVSVVEESVVCNLIGAPCARNMAHARHAAFFGVVCTHHTVVEVCRVHCRIVRALEALEMSPVDVFTTRALVSHNSGDPPPVTHITSSWWVPV